MKNADSKGMCRQCGRPTDGSVCPHCAVRNALDPVNDQDPTLNQLEHGDDPRDGEDGRYGPYRVIRTLGEGGFGIVFLALQTKPIRRHVALKVLKKGIGNGKHLLARFELERQALARMDHPSICRVFDAGESTSGEPYFAMEVVEGRPINRYCQETALPLPKLLALFREVCSAVEHAHQRGVIHRDLKPSNILITERDGEPHPVIIDFGIAKAIEPLLESDTILTLSFQIIGTPVYMSPEQAESGGHDADIRSDVYALGTVLYELLTGRPPISQEELRKVGISAALRMIREADTPPPSTRIVRRDGATAGEGNEGPTRTITARRLRGDLDWITMRALAKNRERRYQSARDLSDDLGRFVAGMPVLAGPPGLVYRGRKFVRRHPAGVAAGVATLMLLLVWLGSREIAASVAARGAKERLLGADHSAASFAVAEASPHLSRLRGDLRRISADAGTPLQARINATLALATADRAEIPRLCDFLLMDGDVPPDPGQVIALQAGIARAPDSVPGSVTSRARDVAESPVAPRERRLRATALLATADPGGAFWPNLVPEVARLACGAGSVRAIRWAPALRPVAPSFLDPLERIFDEESDLPSGLSAAILLGEFQAGNAEALAGLASAATPAQFQPLALAIHECGDVGLSAARRILAGEGDSPATDTEEARDDRASRRARGAMLLLLGGEGTDVWPLLRREDRGDPRLRTFVIHGFAECGIPASLPIARLAEASDASERAALLLALGSYRKAELGSALRTTAIDKATGFYLSDPSAEVHSASEWLLRIWDALPPAGHDPPRAPDLAGDPGTPTWTHDPVFGIDFAVFAGPVRVSMGSPVSEPGRSGDEFQHEAAIPYSFSLATKTLTFAQVKSLLPDYYTGRRPEDTPDAMPARYVSLNDARKLCNLVSAKAGLPSNQWCYTEGDAPLPKPNLTALAGYRFPTEAEWEFACRGGSTAPRFYGWAERLLPEYACFSNGAGGEMRPPGSKRPNGFGMFDMLGNLQNFVEGDYGPYPGAPAAELIPPALTPLMIGLSDGSFELSSLTLLRGQTDATGVKSFRSSARFTNFYPAHVPAHTAGIRLARTLVPGP